MTDFFAGDLSNLALDETSPLPAARPSAKIAARRPGRSEWFRVSTDPQHRPSTFLVYQDQGGRQIFLLTNEVGAHPIMRQVSSRRIAYVASNRNGETFLSLVGAGDDDMEQVRACRAPAGAARMDQARVGQGRRLLRRRAERQ